MVNPPRSESQNEANPRLNVQALNNEWSDYHLQQPQPRGIPNPGILCYRNSALITLLHAPAVVNFFLLHYEHMDKPVIDEDKNSMICLPCYFRIFFEEYWLHRESYLAMWSHLHCLSGTISHLTEYDDKNPQRQEDVMEYLTHVLRISNDHLRRSGKTDAIQDIFQHRLEYQRTCQYCRATKEYGEDYGLFLGAAIDDKGQMDIEQAIDRFLCSPEDATDWTCEYCDGENKSARRGVIRDAPEILLVQVNRFKAGKRWGQHRKLRTSVKFAETLDITENYQGSLGETQDQVLRYQLFAVIYHKGQNITEGHYYTYARGPTGEWSSINDHIVKEARFADVTNAQSRSDCIYVLAYRRQPTVTTRAMSEAADGQPQTRADAGRMRVQAAMDGRSVDIQAQITVGDRALIGDIRGLLTLPDAGPLFFAEGRKRVQPTTVKINMTTDDSKLGGIIKGSLRPQLVPLDRSSHPPAKSSEITPSQSVPSQSALPQELAAEGIDPRKPGPKPHGLKSNGPKSPIPVEGPSKKRKRGQAEESLDPSAKRQRSGHEQKANKGGKPKSKKKNNHNQKKGSTAKASIAANARNGGPGPVHEPSKPGPGLVLKVRNSDAQAGVPVAYPEKTSGEHSREHQEEVLEDHTNQKDVQRGDQRSTGAYFEGDLVQPPPQPPVRRQPAQVKTQRPPKPPPREGTRKNPPRKGRK